ncbi:MAG: non-homologous end-joining DNA ligase [Salaquimonas sp.]|nr:non-homologous end-joining DNA ligase [Salaquimonas sp.]
MKLTHPERIYWADADVTKADLADHYASVWGRMAPFVAGRPLALLRCPEGSAGECFFQKHAWKGLAGTIRVARDPEDNETIVAVDDLDGLTGLVQGASLEIHPWQAALADLERPDQIVMDLDPGEETQWDAVTTAAFEVRERLEAAGLAAFVKTTGGNGLHVVSPLKPKAGWQKVFSFARALAQAMAEDSPERYVAVVAKEKRVGKVLIDYLRNGRGATAIAPYSTRARAGASVAMPLDWDEVGPDIRSNHFTVANAGERLRQADPWQDFRAQARPLES